MWQYPPKRVQSKLKYSGVQIEGLISVKWMVEDKAAEKAWLIHDSGLWCEGVRDGDGWLFGTRFRI